MLSTPAQQARNCRFGFLLIPSIAFACAGPDHLTDPVVSEGGAYFQQFGNGAATSSVNAPSGGTGNNSAANGGTNASNYVWERGSRIFLR
ncbi:MAG TPA: hypothetical protein VIV60_28315 [Polyangiaceae bacterium]